RVRTRIGTGTLASFGLWFRRNGRRCGLRPAELNVAGGRLIGPIPLGWDDRAHGVLPRGRRVEQERRRDDCGRDRNAGPNQNLTLADGTAHLFAHVRTLKNWSFVDRRDRCPLARAFGPGVLLC